MQLSTSTREWRQLHQDLKEADQALDSCLDSLGTPGFLTALHAYYDAMRKVSQVRLRTIRTRAHAPSQPLELDFA